MSESEDRAKYTADDRKRMAKSGVAMPDGGYPIADKEDLQSAIRLVGQGSEPNPVIRRHIIKRARALGLTNLLPDTWASDGSLKSEDLMGIEDRTVGFTLTRDADGDSDGLTLEGYAAVFNSPTTIRGSLGDFEEVIAPGAFKKSLSERSPVLMFDHGHHPILGQMPIGSIQRAHEDSTGLHIRARLFDNWSTVPLQDAIREQAIDGMSFRFETIRDTRDSSRTPKLRTLREVKLYELGPVVFPAYADTSVALRSLAAHVPGLTLSMSAEPVDETAQVSTSEDAVREDTSEEAAKEEDAPTEGHPSPYDHTFAARQRRGRQIAAVRRGIGRK